MQKSYFFVLFGYLLLVTFATRTNLKVPSIAYIPCFALIAMFSAFLFSVTQFTTFHFAVLIKPFLLFFYIIFFYSLLSQHFTINDLPKIKKHLMIVFVIQLIFIALQIILGDITPLKIISFKEIYSGITFRAPGTFDWVYVTCHFLNFFLILYICELFFSQNKKSSLLFLLLIFIAILLSQSKTGYLATIIIILYFTVMSILLRLGIAKKILVTFLIVLCLLASLIIVFDINLSYIDKFLELVQKGKLDGSTSTRKFQTITALTEGVLYWYKGSPMALHGVIIENSYLDYLFRYGLLGLICFLAMIFTYYIYTLRVCITTKQLYDKKQISFIALQLSLACHISFFAAALYSFTGTPIDAYRSALWSTFIIALSAYINTLNKEAIKTSQKKNIRELQ